jgi:lipid A 3-O-deacylase
MVKRSLSAILLMIMYCVHPAAADRIETMKLPLPTHFAYRLLTVASLACAMPLTVRAEGVTLHLGEFKGYQHAMLAYESRTFCRPAFFDSAVDVSLEASLGYASPPAGGPHGSLWHVGMTTLARYWLTPATAIEYGLGANVFSDTMLGAKNISTQFQFGNTLGIVHRFSGTPWSTGLRYTHYSNAGIDTPNPGQDYFHLRIGYSFK